MTTASPIAPRVAKGGLVAFRPPDPVPVVIAFQYNPDEVQRTLQLRGSEGGGRGDASRVSGPPGETLSFKVEIDAADQLAAPAANPITVQNGLHPVIAALEALLFPPYALVVANEALAMAGSAFIQGEEAPLVLLVWGQRRIVPVRLDSLTIREQAFDQALNPIRVEVDLAATVQTYRDLEVTNPGYWVYLAAFGQKEVMAALNTFGTDSGIRGILPI